MDEVFLTIRGQRHSLWRAVDQDGNVLDILVQSRRPYVTRKDRDPSSNWGPSINGTENSYYLIYT
jgi:hypothetical protein